MKHTLLLVLSVLFSGWIWAAPKLEEGKKYRIMCTYWNMGGVQEGSYSGTNYPLFYNISDESSESVYWYFIPTGGEGEYMIQSAASGKYITYDGIRIEESKRYVDLTSTSNGDYSKWQIVSDGDSYILRNVQQPDHVMDARKDSYMVGSYSATFGFSENERFCFVDEEGKIVTEGGPVVTGNMPQFVDSLVINGKKAVFDSRDERYFQSVSPKFMEDMNYEASVNVFLKDPTLYELTINDQSVSSTSFVFENFREGTTFALALKDKESGETVAQANLVFTFMPLVEVTGTGFNGSDYMPGTLRVTDPDHEGADLLMNAKYRYRGATASTLNKKAYAVKILDEYGESMDASFFGFRSDNNWILDAMAIDPGRMRNRVSTDLWNDFSIKPYHFAEEPEAINGTRGRFVEIFVNGTYEGVYCMTEKVDRKQLKLKKIEENTDPSITPTIRGALYKSSQWGYAVFMGHEQNSSYYPMSPVTISSWDNYNETWQNWEMQYPDVTDGEPIDWQPLADAINVPASKNMSEFTQEVGQQFDLPVFRDYYLFIELILATDNHGKNIFLHHYNQQKSKMVSITPWDLDGTWGRRWDGSDFTSKFASMDFVSYLWAYEHGEHTLYKRLAEYNYAQWNERLALRYAELRPTFFDEDSLYNRFAEYVKLYQMSGAEQREINRWNGSNNIYIDLNNELEYLKEWIHERVRALDVQYAYDPTTTDITTPQSEEDIFVSGDRGAILVRTHQPQEITVYNISGIAVKKQMLRSGVNRIEMNRPGIYLVGGSKVVVR